MNTRQAHEGDEEVYKEEYEWPVYINDAPGQYLQGPDIYATGQPSYSPDPYPYPMPMAPFPDTTEYGGNGLNCFDAFEDSASNSPSPLLSSVNTPNAHTYGIPMLPYPGLAAPQVGTTAAFNGNAYIGSRNDSPFTPSVDTPNIQTHGNPDLPYPGLGPPQVGTGTAFNGNAYIGSRNDSPFTPSFDMPNIQTHGVPDLPHPRVTPPQVGTTVNSNANAVIASDGPLLFPSPMDTPNIQANGNPALPYPAVPPTHATGSTSSPRKRRLKCETCGEDFDRKMRCKNQHLGVKPYRCGGLCGKQSCNAGFMSDYNRKRHENQHKTKCPKCHKLCDSQNFPRHSKTCKATANVGPSRDNDDDTFIS